MALKIYVDFHSLFRLCPKLGQYAREFDASPEWKKHYSEYTAPLLADVEGALGLKYKLSKSVKKG